MFSKIQENSAKIADNAKKLKREGISIVKEQELIYEQETSSMDAKQKAVFDKERME